jgi:hypothetical protein
MNSHQQHKRFFGWGVAVLVISAACASGGSHFKRAVSVADAFEQYKLIPDYQYYISGRDDKPIAIVALREDYKLTSPHWRKVEPDREQLRKWVERMRMQPGAEFNMEPNGARVLDQQGNPIGAWYSVWATPLLNFESEKEIIISQPMTIFPSSNRNRGNDGEPDWAP